MEPQVSASSYSPTRNLKPVACFWLTDASLWLLDTIIFRSAYRPFLTAEDSFLIEVHSPLPSFIRLKSAFGSVASLRLGAPLHHPHHSYSRSAVALERCADHPRRLLPCLVTGEWVGKFMVKDVRTT